MAGICPTRPTRVDHGRYSGEPDKRSRESATNLMINFGRGERGPNSSRGTSWSTASMIANQLPTALRPPSSISLHQHAGLRVQAEPEDPWFAVQLLRPTRRTEPATGLGTVQQRTAGAARGVVVRGRHLDLQRRAFVMVDLLRPGQRLDRRQIRGTTTGQPTRRLCRARRRPRARTDAASLPSDSSGTPGRRSGRGRAENSACAPRARRIDAPAGALPHRTPAESSEPATPRRAADRRRPRRAHRTAVAPTRAATADTPKRRGCRAPG